MACGFPLLSNLPSRGPASSRIVSCTVRTDINDGYALINLNCTVTHAVNSLAGPMRFLGAWQKMDWDSTHLRSMRP